MESRDTTYIAEMRDVVKVFPGVRALDHVDFRLRPGEIHGLVGKNGAGKSTLMNVFTGIYPLDGGEIWVQGDRIENMTTGKAKNAGVAYVHQHSQLIPPLTIAENIFCGSLPTGRLGLVDWRRLNREAKERLQRVGLEIDVQRKVEGLTVAERQMMEIAKALFADAQVIILDEATAPLPKDEVEMLFNFVRRQRDRGASFIYISHYIEEVFELCDIVTVLRDGKLVGTYPTSELTQPELVRLISGVQVERFQREKRKQGEVPALEVEDLTLSGSYYDINLTVQEGEVVGLTGLEGCGKAMLARGLFGLLPMGDGQVRVAGRPYKTRSPGEAFAQGLAYLPRDRHSFGIVGLRSVKENITLPILRRLLNSLRLIDLERERVRVEDYVDKLKIATPTIRQPVEFLSGGNQQKVVFAKLASTEPKVLLLDEPTQGVDVQAKVEIMKIVDELSQQGVGVVFVSEEIREMMDVCDRIIAMYAGRIVTEFDTRDPELTVDKILLAVEGSLSEDEQQLQEVHP
jgi:ABC-type sugar transport system ATPase subunit